ncbi:acyl-CoA dehydrogenase [Rhodococcus sp. MS16]|uniref:acyl-CoA dehydrogenase n=1 Tax=Rhodococcus sp. MS16 TaxID=2579941 RepID=UPI0015629428|nr:acyl-CoA dehydrogenase [Rhodococcus sp. MS16]
MDLTPTPESLDIRDTVGALVSEMGTESIDAGDTMLRERADELGLSLLLVPESLGGLELDLSTAVLVLEMLGRRPTRLPWITDIVAVPTLFSNIGHLSSVHPLAEASASSSQRFALARPIQHRGCRTQRVDLADAVLDIREDQLSTWTAHSWHPTTERSLTGHVDLWTTDADSTSVGPLPRGETTRVINAARTAAAAFVLGAARAALDLAVEHAKNREQFGRTIGSFQAVKHLLASAMESITMAAPLIPAAAHASTTNQACAAIDAALALRQCSKAAVESVHTAIQVHGAIGYTDETALGGLLAQVEATRDYWGPAGLISDEIAESLLNGSMPR